MLPLPPKKLTHLCVSPSPVHSLHCRENSSQNTDLITSLSCLKKSCNEEVEPQILTLTLKAFHTPHIQNSSSGFHLFSISIPIPDLYLEVLSFIQDLVHRSSSLRCPAQLAANALFRHLVSRHGGLFTSRLIRLSATWGQRLQLTHPCFPSN